MVWVFHYITEGLQKHITLVNETEASTQQNQGDERNPILLVSKQENQGYATLIDFINQPQEEKMKNFDIKSESFFSLSSWLQLLCPDIRF